MCVMTQDGEGTGDPMTRRGICGWDVTIPYERRGGGGERTVVPGCTQEICGCVVESTKTAIFTSVREEER